MTTVHEVKDEQPKAAKHPHKSTTHEEMFFHITEPIYGYRGATVFFRKNADGYWHGAAAFCSMRDMFSRRIGRCQARRRYFRDGCHGSNLTERPKYDDALRVAKREAETIEQEAHA